MLKTQELVDVDLVDVDVDVDKTVKNRDIMLISDFRGKDVYHYTIINDFYEKTDVKNIKLMISIIEGIHNKISLRFLEWYVTRYCSLYKTTINIDTIYVKQKNFNINISYKAQLKSFRKKLFDPFKRKIKFYYVTKDGETLLTTLGQLNFFKWIIKHDIIDYITKNYEQIMLKYDHVNSYFKKNSDTSTYSSQEIDNATNFTTMTPTVSRNINIYI